uniref:COMM domain-containing protein 3 n=1 Tax=Plectus sambesii TaxID=2011161 RepID=A0A914XGH7_9BILA
MTSFSPRIANLVNQATDVCRQKSEAELIDTATKTVQCLLTSKAAYSESLCTNIVAEAIWSVLIEAAKRNLSEEDLTTNLPPSSTLSSALIHTYKEYRKQLRSLLESIGWRPDQVIDVDWKMTYQAESNLKSKIGSPVCDIDLKTIATDSTELSKVSFQCSAEQLQDLVWKLKEANKAVERASK